MRKMHKMLMNRKTERDSRHTRNENQKGALTQYFKSTLMVKQVLFKPLLSYISGVQKDLKKIRYRFEFRDPINIHHRDINCPSAWIDRQ